MPQISQELLDTFRDVPQLESPLPTVGVEEQLLEVEHGLETLNLVDRRLEDMDRLVDMSTGLEELTAIADRIETSTATDIALVQTSLSLALAGTGMESHHLAPGLEDSLGARISTESLQKTADKIWKAIVATIRRIWEGIRDFFVGAKGDATRLNLAVTQVRHQAENLSGVSISQETMELGREINVLSTFHRPPRHAKDVIDGLSEFKRQATVILGPYTDEIIKLGKAMAREIQVFDPEKCDQSLEKLTDLVESFNLSRLLGSSVSLTEVTDGRWDKGTAFRPPTLMGNKSLFFTYPKPRGEGTSIRSRAEAARNRRAFIAMSSPEPATAVSGGSVKTFPARSVVEITHLINDLTRLVSDYQPRAKELERLQGTMETASRFLGTLLEKHSLDPHQRACVTSALKFNVAFSNWATQPQASLVSLTLAAARASLTASRKSLKNH